MRIRNKRKNCHVSHAENQVDSGYAARVRDLDARFQVEYPRISAAAGTSWAALADSMAAVDARFLFTARYDSLTAFLDAHAAALAAAYPGDPGVPLVARLMPDPAGEWHTQQRSKGENDSPPFLRCSV